MDANRNPYTPKSIVEDLKQIIAEESELETEVRVARKMIEKAKVMEPSIERLQILETIARIRVIAARDKERIRGLLGEWSVRAKDMSVKGTLEDIHYIAELNTITRSRSERKKKRPTTN